MMSPQLFGDGPPVAGKVAEKEMTRQTLRKVEIRSSVVAAGNRGPDDVVHPLGTCCEHDEPVEAQRGTRGLRHDGKRGEEVLVYRIALAVDLFLLVHIGGEAAPLLIRICEFAKGVGEF